MQILLNFIFNVFDYQSTENNNADNVKWIVISSSIINIGSMIIIAIMHYWHCKDICKGILQYIFFTATYTHTFLIYSFCNIDDVTWGTKGIAAGGTKEYRDEKIKFVFFWMCSNALVSYALLVINGIW